MDFVSIVIETGVIYLAASRAQIHGCSLYLCLGLAVAEVAAWFLLPIVLLGVPWLGLNIWATYALSLFVLLGFMLLFLEGGLGQILYAWFLASLGIVAWKLLYGLLISYGTARLMAAALCSNIYAA
ncbi:MAG: hypothetical protein A2Y63_02780 [Candidatus Riflebacteria bacterium RBG_13_59_9]|nr:MAG: hypothetical protein A2Y63_02780 [Candidatus Riflebacteria bacterium RBG_13_59_9]